MLSSRHREVGDVVGSATKRINLNGRTRLPNLDRPALVWESTGHVPYANSAARIKANVDRDTPNPAAGRYVHAERAELSGRLEESSASAAFAVGFPLASGEALVGRSRDLLSQADGTGVTLLHDCGIGSIEIGTSADFELLEDDPRAIDPTTISKIVVSQPRLAGKVRFSR